MIRLTHLEYQKQILVRKSQVIPKSREEERIGRREEKKLEILQPKYCHYYCQFTTSVYSMSRQQSQDSRDKPAKTTQQRQENRGKTADSRGDSRGKILVAGGKTAGARQHLRGQDSRGRQHEARQQGQDSRGKTAGGKTAETREQRKNNTKVVKIAGGKPAKTRQQTAGAR
jgi:hypothetical protein